MPRHKDTERDRVMSDTRRMLLEAATAEFAREGYNGANINRISRTAGFAKGTIYNYFPSKRALMLALIDLIAASHHQYMVEQVQQEGDPVRRLQRFFEAGLAWIVDNLAQGRVMLTMLNGPDAEFKLRMWQGYQPMHQLLITDILVPGMEIGLFRQLNPVATAALLMTLYLGIGSAVNDEGRSQLPADWIAGFVLEGLRKQAVREPEVEG
ncbi:MAG: TetR/AcrR family transcriptional regulator [Anaerolineae bacterium]|jgi:AcrR family transcriptional regulator